MTVKKHLRATYGLDQGNEKVINVGYPQDSTDGVNIQYFVDKNTVQQYDENRGYDENFIISYKRKLYSAARNIANPAGPFDIQQWNEIRVDTLWETFNHQSTFTISPEAGKQILYDIRFQPRSLILPVDPNHGDSIWIKDNFNALPYNTFTVTTTKYSLQTGGSEFKPSTPGEMNMFTWDNNQKYWRVFRFISEQSQNTVKSTVKPSKQEPVQVGVNQTVTVNSLEKNHEIKFPIFANDNEIITIIDEHQNLGQNPLKINCFNDSYKINNQNGHYYLDKPGITKFIFKKIDNNWHSVFQVSEYWKKITQNYKTKAFEKLHLQPTQNITITLPDSAAIGDEIVLANTYGYRYTVTIVPSEQSQKIVGDINQQYNRKYQQLTEGKPSEVTQFILPANAGTYVQFTYLETGKWYVNHFTQRIEHVDENNRTRPGIAPLADQNEVNKNHEQNPSDDQIVTPKTLANKTSTETRRGISRIATPEEANLPTSGNHLHDVIITPKTLNHRQATEEIRGVAEVTTNQEVKDNCNDTHIITPKKLDHRRATEQLSGVALLVQTNNPTAANSRSTEGTGVYKHLTNNIDIVTPKQLQQAQATENSKGVAYISTQQEANEAKEDASDQVIITPKKLSNRTALEGRTGVARMVNRSSNEHKKDIANQLHQEVFITPKALAEREATEQLTGIAYIATQTDVDSGTLDTKIITPKKFKAWNKYDHFVTNTETGIEHQGNIWDRVSFTIRPATETQVGTLRTATQIEANTQENSALDNVYITPKKLDGRRATQQLYGIAKIATNSEVDSGTLNNETFIQPAGLLRWTRTQSNAQFTEDNRGVGKAANTSQTWVGNQTSGQTQTYQNYDDDLIVTPKKLNYALQNYLPKLGKAYDSDRLDGLDSTQYLRSDVDTTNSARLTVNKQTRVGALYLNPIQQQETSLSTDVLKDQSGGLIYQNNTNFVLDNNVRNANSFIFDIGGVRKAELTNTGEFRTTTSKVTNTDTTNLTVQGIMTYKGQQFDDYFVKQSGHTMTGNLLIRNPNEQSKLQLDGTATESSTPELNLVQQAGNGQFVVEPSGNLVIKKQNSWKLAIQNDAVSIKDRLIVKNQEIVDDNGKISYNFLKDVPTATIARYGITKLQNSLDESSETLAPQMKAFHDLKTIVDSKADLVGSEYRNMKIREYLQIGNIRLIPDYENRTINFVLVNTPEEST